MIKVNFEELVGKHLCDGCSDFFVRGKYYNNIVVEEAEYDEENDDFVPNGSERIKTKSEIEAACKFDIYNGRNVQIIMGFDDESEE